MKYCNPIQDISAYLCDVPSPWRDAFAEALSCALSLVQSANANAEANPNCDGVKDCESVTQFITSIEDNILTANFVNEKNITVIRSIDLTDVFNVALNGVDPKCLMTQEEWDVLTYQERLDSIFAKVCCVHNNCAGNSGSGCGCDDCGDEDVECIGLEACPCVTYQVNGTAPFTFTYKDCDTKEITEFESTDDDLVQICAIRGSVITPDGVFCNEVLDECSDLPITTTTTSTSTTSTSTTSTSSTSTTTTTTLVPPTTTTTTSTTTTTTLPFPTTTTTTSTTSTSTTTTTTEAPIMGIANNSTRYSNDDSIAHCSLPNNTIYTEDGQIFSGNIAYIDILMTNPLTGFTFISDSFLSVIYHIDAVTGLIGANSGQSC